jgi:hypothetical protein
MKLRRPVTPRSTRFLILLALLICSACSVGKSKSIAEAGVAQFHSQFNAGKFHEIYVESDDRMKKAATETEFVAFLEAIRRKLGSIEQSSQAGWTVNATTSGTSITLVYNTDFHSAEFGESKGKETFAFHISGDQATLSGYHVDSPTLITR